MSTQGARVADGELADHPFQDGAYGRALGIHEPGRWDWMAVTPNGHAANLSAHDVVEHDDGTITVSPSILVTKRQRMEDGAYADLVCWHGWLERGVWRDTL